MRSLDELARKVAADPKAAAFLLLDMCGSLKTLVQEVMTADEAAAQLHTLGWGKARTLLNDFDEGILP